MEGIRYSRADLPRLKSLDRKAVYEVLHSFDAEGLAQADFVPRALALLDPARIPGLDGPDPLAALLQACRGGSPLRREGGEYRKTADDALENRFTFYGEAHILPPSIDWDFNPGTAHWGHDLNRFSYLEPLAAAFHATGEVRYGRKALDLMLHWIAKNDFARSFAGGGYAFGSYLNLAIHAPAWARCIRSLAEAGLAAPVDVLRVLKSLHDHLAYLEIVTNGHQGNWPTIGCMGMLATLEAVPFLKITGGIADYCRASLAAQVAEQVLPDGVQDELTPHYHQVVINNLVSAQRSLRALGASLDDRTLETLAAMVRYSQMTVMPDGSKQLAFNDSDPRAVPDLAKQMAGVGLEKALLPPAELGPRCYPYAGVAFLRQRPDRGDLYLAFDAGPFGRAHQHEDKLGFWLFAYGRNFIVDPGRHLYDSSAVSFRDHLRSTRAHSTILVDGQGQNSAAFRETWIARQPLDLGWEEKPGEVRARGCYELGYGKDNAIKTVHRREIVFVRERFWVIFDAVEGEESHEVESRFQFGPGSLAWRAGRAVTGFPDANLLLWPSAGEGRIEEGRRDPKGGWYSDGYNMIEPAPALALTLKGALPVRMAVLLLPFRGTEPPALEWSFDGKAAVVTLAGMESVRVETRL